MITLSPAYGKNYFSTKSVVEEYLDGYDFILHETYNNWDGKLCSYRDFGGKIVTVKYHTLTLVDEPNIVSVLTSHCIYLHKILSSAQGQY